MFDDEGGKTVPSLANIFWIVRCGVHQVFVCQFGLAGSVRFVVPVFTRFSSGESTYSRMFSCRRVNNTKRPPTPSTRSISETVRPDDPVAGSTTVVVGATVVVEAMVVGTSVVVVVGFAIHWAYNVKSAVWL